MLARLTSLASITLIAGAIAGCETIDSRTKETKSLNAGDSMLLSADIRTISKVTRDSNIVTCAEPSPDVARALSQSGNFGGSLAVSGLPAGIEPKLALAAAQAQAESAAQLGERLATIQLLRDGLYRACEAYANGAISKTAYAVMLARFDDTMITMLLGEIAGGAFGRSLATLGGTADGSAKAVLDTQEKLKDARETADSLKTARELNDQAQAAVDAAGADATQAAKENLEETKRNVRNLERELAEKLEAAATSAATATATAAGSIAPGQQNTEIAATLHGMQRKYMENINFDAIEVACISALEGGETTDFVKLCNGGLLASVQKQKGALLQLILLRAWTELDNAQQGTEAVKGQDGVLAGIERGIPAGGQ